MNCGQRRHGLIRAPGAGVPLEPWRIAYASAGRSPASVTLSGGRSTSRPWTHRRLPSIPREMTL